MQRDRVQDSDLRNNDVQENHTTSLSREPMEIKQPHFCSVSDAENDGFYFSPHVQIRGSCSYNNNAPFQLTDTEHRQKYGRNALGDLNEHRLLGIDPAQIVDAELRRIAEVAAAQHGQLHQNEYIVLATFLGFDFFARCLRMCDQRHVKQIVSDSLQRTVYHVMNETVLKMRQRRMWKTVQHERKERQQNVQRIRNKMNCMSFDEAQIFAKKQAEKDQQKVLKKTQCASIQTASKAHFNVWSFTPKCMTRAPKNRRKVCRQLRKDAERELLSDERQHHMAQKQRLRQQRRNQRRRKLTVQQRLQYGKHQCIWPTYRQQLNALPTRATRKTRRKEKTWRMKGILQRQRRKERKRKIRKYKARIHKRGILKHRMHYTVFGDDHGHGQNRFFCNCSSYKRMLRRLYVAKSRRARDLNEELPSLPYCKHIIAVRLAKIHGSMVKVTQTEEKWSNTAIQHVVHNVTIQTYREYFTKKKNKKSKSCNDK